MARGGGNWTRGIAPLHSTSSRRRAIMVCDMPVSIDAKDMVINQHVDTSIQLKLSESQLAIISQFPVST